MTQTFMYKRVNIFLLILMSLIVVGLAASAIFFQESFKNLNNNYEGVVNNFTACADVLSVKEESLHSCLGDLNSTSQDIGKYDLLYERKVDDLQTAQTELQLTSLELKKTKKEVVDAQNQFQQEQKRSIELERQIQYLNQQIVSLESSLRHCDDNLDACEAGS